MQIKVRYFGMLADRLGMTGEDLELQGDGLSCDLRALLLERHPVLEGMVWKLAVDQHLVEGPCDVHENSEIVLLPPFAGG